PAPGGAVLDGTAPTALVRAHLGPDTGGRALVPTRSDAERPTAGRAVRAARRVPTQRATGRPLRPRLVLTRSLALAPRAGTRGEEDQGRLGNRGGAGRRGGMAGRRDPVVSRRSGRPRAAGVA